MSGGRIYKTDKSIRTVADMVGHIVQHCNGGLYFVHQLDGYMVKLEPCTNRGRVYFTTSPFELPVDKFVKKAPPSNYTGQEYEYEFWR